MPRKRDRFLDLFNRSRTGSPAPPVQQSNSSIVGPTSPTIPSNRTSAVTQANTAPLSAVPMVLPASQISSSRTSTTLHHPQPYQASSSGAILSVKEVVTVAKEGVKTALVFLKESSDWLPQLKAATGGLVALIDAIELTSSNGADLELLRQKIDNLTSIIKENSQDLKFPWLLRRLSEFAVKLDEMVKDIEEKSNHGILRRFAEGKKDKKDITEFVGAVTDLVIKLQFELSLYTSRGINKLLSSKSLDKLKESVVAFYNAPLSAQLIQRRGCTANTRQKILEDLMKWAMDPRGSKLYWMNGMAGTGKTTIAYSFCEQLQEKGLLGANFFCSRSLAECSDIRYIIPTMARQLARSCPQFATALVEVLGADSQSPSLENQVKQLLSEPFRLTSEPVTDTLVVVIDALDECSNGASEIRSFLERICNYLGNSAIPLKVFITSRPEVAISRAITPLNPSSPSEWSVVRIHDIEESFVQADIKVYVEDELTEIAKTWGLEDGWPPSTEVDAVVRNSNRLFIYAATAIRYVTEDSGDPCMRLSEMASTPRGGKGGSQNSGLTTELVDDLYRAILKRAFHKLNQVEHALVRATLKLIVCAQTPLTFGGIADLLNASGGFEIRVSTSTVRTSLKLLPSVISTPRDGDGVVTTFHASFSDFLFDSHSCGSVYHIPFRQSNQDLARWCLHLMDKNLTVDNITGSDRSQRVDGITNQKTIKNWISDALAYACIFWASHIIDIDEGIESLSVELDGFLSSQLPRWLEVLSLLKRLDIAVEGLQRMKECKHSLLSSKFYDAYKFLRDIFDIINVWPLEVFHSGLVWAPEQSFIRKTYAKNTLPAQIVLGCRPGWGSSEHTIRGHSGQVNSIALAPNGRRMVSGSWDKTIRIWNLSTGEVEQILQGHSGGVLSVAFSHGDGRGHIVSGANDSTVRIWNPSTGEEERVLRGHSSTVFSVDVSFDNSFIVSGSYDNTIRIWDLSTGEEELVLRGHLRAVNSVAFAPDNRHIASGSYDKTIRVWNLSTSEEELVLQGHTDGVNSVAVSPNNFHIVSGSSDHTVRIWKLSTGEEEHVLRGDVGAVLSVAFASDNRHIVSGSCDSTVRVWNVSTGQQEHVLRNSYWVNKVAVLVDNHHIVYAPDDNTIRIWNPSAAEEYDGAQGHLVVYSIAVSHGNRYVVSGTGNAIRIWNSSTGKEEDVLQAQGVLSVAVSPDNRCIVSGSSDNTVRIWNVSTREVEHILQGHSGSVWSITVSPDNRRIVSGSDDKTVRIWNFSTGEIEHILRGHSERVISVVVSLDNRHIVTGTRDNTVRIWGASTCEEEPPMVFSFTISDSCFLISGPRVRKDAQDVFISSVTTLIALLAQGDSIVAIPVFKRLASGEKLDPDILRLAMQNGPAGSLTLSADQSSILLTNGENCLAIPSVLRDITCAAFSGSIACFGHQSGRITILEIKQSS